GPEEHEKGLNLHFQPRVFSGEEFQSPVSPGILFIFPQFFFFLTYTTEKKLPDAPQSHKDLLSVEERTDTMEETAEKTPLEPCSISKPQGLVYLKKTTLLIFITAGTLLIFGGIAAFYLWNVSEKELVTASFSRDIDIKIEESDARDAKTVEVQDFKAGITAVKFPGKEKCFIKSQVKAELSEVDSEVKFEPLSLVWLVTEEPLKDRSFLSPEILRFCADLPIYWHHAANSRALRKRRSVQRVRRQNIGRLNRQQAGRRNSTRTEEPTAQQFNPENPYHQSQEEGTMVFDPMLDHMGICCIECQRSYSHCQQVCEPLGGYEPWPYNYHGCRQVCRSIMPCRWWAARVLGLV
ncbi:hypothetical protein DNTS_018936, partial [Danionella cerebrum]